MINVAMQRLLWRAHIRPAHLSCGWYRNVVCACAIRDAGRKSRLVRRQTAEPPPQQQQQQQQQQGASFSTQSRDSRKRPKKDTDKRSHCRCYKHTYLVSCHPGLEQATADELQQPGLELAQAVEVLAPGRVTFSSNSLAGGYAAALRLRSATRVLHLIYEEDLNPNRAAGDTVYEATRRAAPWQELLRPGQTFGVHCLHFYNNSNITNSQLVARRVRDAVCDAIRDARGVRPAPPEDAPDLLLVFQMLKDKLQLFRDLGGGSLHRRGYRSGSAVHKAALNEAAAAGLLLLAGWQEECQLQGMVLADPMCGSGTFLVEAALIATSTAPGLLRHSWPFESWHDHDQQVQAEWAGVQQLAQQRARQGLQDWQDRGGHLLGNDLHEGAIRLARQAADSAGMSDLITFNQGPCGTWVPPRTPQLVVANPPWGMRLLGDTDDGSSSSSRGGRGRREGGSRQQQRAEGDGESELAETWQQLSSFLKQQCPGANAWVLSGSPSVTQYLGMRSCKKRSVSIGGVKTAWLNYAVRGPQPQASN